MREIKFENLTFRPGINFTVRLGEKWKNLSIGEWVKIGNEVGEITAIYVCRFGSIPHNVYSLEHDKVCSNYNGLFKTFRKIYPELNDNLQKIDWEIVTCIGFIIKG